MAKTRAQRKAEKRRRQEQQQRRQPGAPSPEAREEGRAQQDTQLGVSGDVAEAEAIIETGADVGDYGEHTVPPEDDGGDGAATAAPEAPAPSRADVGRPAKADTKAPEKAEGRRARRQREKEQRRKARAKELQKGQPERAEKQRGAVVSFLVSCWAELKKVQWPDRDTLVQASAVTIIFVFVAAAYLGALDFIFNELIQLIL